ncbi:MAG: Mbeg1-like protein [Eubacteriales bacterium]
MANLFDYLDWRGDLTFDRSPFCDIDALILSELSYIDYAGIVPGIRDGGGVKLSAASRRFFEQRGGETGEISLGALISPKIILLLKRAASSARFGGEDVLFYECAADSQTEEQFGAVCFSAGIGTLFAAFRGTDDTLVGWKENFNMTFRSPVPSQIHAERYLRALCGAFDGNLIIGGHSKGGNLAVWAASSCGYCASRITAVYNFDGPGFSVDLKQKDGYAGISGKIRTFVPECSVVGMFLNHEEKYTIVKSENRGLWQHDALSWVIRRNKFVKVRTLSKEMARLNFVLSEFLRGMDDDAKERFTESFFDMLVSTKAETLTQLKNGKLSLLKAFRSAEPEVKKALLAALKLFLGESAKGAAGFFKKPFSRGKQIEQAENMVKTEKIIK